MFSSDTSKVVTDWITKGRIMSASRDFFETADAVARVLEINGAVNNRTSSPAPINGEMTWTMHFYALDGQWEINGDETYFTLITPEGGVDARPYDLAPRGVFATIIVQALTGKTYIPARTRREIKAAEQSGENDARSRFRRGMRAIMDSTIAIEAWTNLEDSEVWERIEVAAGMVYPNSLRVACVPLQTFDVYDDAYYQAAYDLVHTIR